MRRWLAIAGVALVLGAILLGVTRCPSAWLKWGLWVRECPDGVPRVRATVTARTHAHSHDDPATPWRLHLRTEAVLARRDRPLWGTPWTAPVASTPEFWLGDRPVECIDPDQRWAGYQECSLQVPEGLPDGHHTLRVEFDNRIEPRTVEVSLPFFAPALAHVLTDRPLYSPGDDVMFRSLTLHRAGLTPTSDRPGTWEVIDPSGTVVLEEPGETGPWGVAASSLPLAQDAPSGDWTVRWTTGADEAEATIAVRPFSLPRFTVTASSAESWLGIGDSPSLAGVVKTNAGAPIAGATVRVRLAATGAWPLPTEWLRPRELVTDRDGAFSLPLSPVPVDLGDLQRTVISLEAVAPAGDRAVGGMTLVLSPDPIAVEGVTEFSGGLVEGRSNRVYLRVTTPDGRPLPDLALTVKRSSEPGRAGWTARTDADGVAALQLDPGAPVHLMDPPPPVRAPLKRVRTIRLATAVELTSERAADLAELRDLEALADVAEARCGELVTAAGSLDLLLWTEGPRVRLDQGAANTPLRQCVSRVFSRASVGEPAARVLAATLSLRPDPELARLVPRFSGGTPTAVRERLDAGLITARRCVADRTDGGPLPWSLRWSLAAGSKTPRVEVIPRAGQPGAAVTRDCLAAALRGLSLEDSEKTEAMGAVTLMVDAPARAKQTDTGPRTHLGYELTVSAEGVGETRWRAVPGEIPDLRVRPSTALPAPGEIVTVSLLRGPDYRGDPPPFAELRQGAETLQRCTRLEKAEKHTLKGDCPPLAGDGRVALRIPDDARGLLSIHAGEASALVHVRPKDAARMVITSDRDEAAPGDTVVLELDAGAPAVVSLTGIDAALGGLVSLPTPSALAGVTVEGSAVEGSAVGAGGGLAGMDAVALVSGAVRGESAALAVLQSLEADPGAARPQREAVEATVDPQQEEPVSVAFYTLLDHARKGVRTWESTAPSDQLLSNARYAALWAEAVAERGELVDAHGRPLHLHLLPDDLLAEADPRHQVRDGARLPEDIEAWVPWVREQER